MEKRRRVDVKGRPESTAGNAYGKKPGE